MGNIQAAIEHIYPLVEEFRKERSAEDIKTMAASKRARLGHKRKEFPIPDEEEEVECLDDEDEDEMEITLDSD